MKYILIILPKLLIFILWTTPMVSLSMNNTPIGSLELDSTIRYGRLINGFTYYIKHQDNASNVEMNLWVKAGYYNQSIKQPNVAHLIEHLPFRSTENFPGYNIKLNPIFKKYKIKRIEGYTMSSHTEYKLTAPLKSGIDGISAGLLWFKDIGNLKISEYNVIKEANVLRQEAIYRSGDFMEWNFSNSKRESQVYSCASDSSTFFEDLENISINEVENFYNKWYRPDRMGLVVVGSIKNLDIIEAKIKDYFSKTPLLGPSIKSNCTEEYLNSQGKFVIIKKTSSNWVKKKNAAVEVFLNFRKMDPALTESYSEKALKHHLIWDAIEQLITHRLKINNINSTIVNQRIPRNKSLLQIMFNNSNGQEKEILKNIVQLLNQINNFGFTSKEWNSIRNIMLQKQFNSSGITGTSYWISQVKNHFLYHEILPKKKSLIIKNILQSLNVEFLNSYISENLRAIPDDISMLVPADNKALEYTKTEIRNWMQQAIEEPITHLKTEALKGEQVEKILDKPVMDSNDISKLPFREISNLGINQATGTETIKLNNGIRVVLNKSGQYQNQNGKITIQGFVPKGANCFSREDYFSAINAPDLIQNKKAAKKVNAYIDNYTSGIEIRGDITNLEKLFQLIYLSYKSPNQPSQKEYTTWKENAENKYFYPSYKLVANDFLEYQQDFLGDQVRVPRATTRYYGIQKTSPQKAYNIYNKLLGDASNYTFIISGNFTNTQVIPLLQKYIGNLPISEKNQLDNCCIKNKVKKKSSPSAPVYLELFAEDIKPIYQMNNVLYALTFISNNKDYYWSWKKHIKLVALSKIIQPQLDKLRYEKNAGLYAPNYSYTNFNQNSKKSKIGIYLGCKEDEFEWLRQECHNIINNIKENGVSQIEFDDVINNKLLPYYVAEPNQNPTKEEVYDYFRFGIPIIKKQEQQEYLLSLTPEDIEDTAKKYFKASNQYEFVMKNTRNKNNSE